MVLTIPISPEIEAKLKAKAAVAGVDVETFATRALEHAIATPSLDEVLAPIRSEYEASGMNEEELVELLEVAKHQLRDQRRGRQPS
jgi:hypothetical protein